MKAHLKTPSDPLRHVRASLELLSVLTRLRLAATQIQWGINELQAGRITPDGARIVLDQALAELAGDAP